MSKIVIGALTAAVWFALSYVAARAESVGGQVSDQAIWVSMDVGHPDFGAVVHRPGVAFPR
ncbi:MAG: hypothetical protein WB760_31105 [Xanthobacteraceae bacterium]